MPPFNLFSILPNLPKLHQNTITNSFHPPSSRLFTKVKPVQTRILEVERKFYPTRTSIEALRSNSGKPAFGTFEQLATAYTHDIYYDANNTLLSQGVYIRKRNGAWQAKIRVGGDYTNLQFCEYEGVESVLGIVRRASDVGFGRGEREGEGVLLGLDDLTPIAEFATKREAWDVEGFRVVVDEADFGYTIGEVELCYALAGREDGEVVGREMDARIETFMRENAWVFPEGKTMSKLAACWLWKARRELGLAFPVPDWARKEWSEGRR